MYCLPHQSPGRCRPCNAPLQRPGRLHRDDRHPLDAGGHPLRQPVAPARGHYDPGLGTPALVRRIAGRPAALRRTGCDLHATRFHFVPDGRTACPERCLGVPMGRRKHAEPGGPAVLVDRFAVGVHGACVCAGDGGVCLGGGECGVKLWFVWCARSRRRQQCHFTCGYWCARWWHIRRWFDRA
jgi:hypothetical protein